MLISGYYIVLSGDIAFSGVKRTRDRGVLSQPVLTIFLKFFCLNTFTEP